MSKRQRAESRCRACQADILWCAQSTGGRLPLNLEAEKITAASVGPFYLLNEFEMICSRVGADVIEQVIANGRSLFTNHLVTCEKRGQPAEDIENVN